MNNIDELVAEYFGGYVAGVSDPIYFTAEQFRSALTRAAEGRWESIETAPIQPFNQKEWFKSGERLLLWTGNYAVIGQYGYTERGIGRWQTSGRNFIPTHWQPLPTPPTD